MSQTGPRVLVVDDEKDYLEDLRPLFSRKFNLTTASSGQEALEILSKEPIAVIVSDQRMPIMSGSELLAQAAQKYPQTVRILLTGYSDIDAVITAVNRGEVYRYIAKDRPIAEIETVIIQAVQKFELEETNRQLLRAKKRLLKSLSVQENLSTVGALGRELHQKIESVVVSLFNYVFSMSRESLDEKAFLVQFQKLQGVLSRLRDLSSFSEKLKSPVSGLRKDSVNTLLREAVDGLKKATAGQDECEVVLDLQDNLVSAPIQTVFFLRAMKEIFENAYLFGPKTGKKITIRSRRVEAKDGEGESLIRIEIENNGKGLSREELLKAGTPFYSTLSAEDPPQGGMAPSGEGYNLTAWHHYGFGLTVAQWVLCMGYHGTLEIESQPGAGAKVVVTLPAT